MDYEEMNRAYESAKKTQDSVNKYPNGWTENSTANTTYSTYKQHMSVNSQPETSFTPTEHDYSIVKMPNGNYVVARSQSLGSLDYAFVCECVSHWEARQIVRSLNK